MARAREKARENTVVVIEKAFGSQEKRKEATAEELAEERKLEQERGQAKHEEELRKAEKKKAEIMGKI